MWRRSPESVSDAVQNLFECIHGLQMHCATATVVFVIGHVAPRQSKLPGCARAYFPSLTHQKGRGSRGGRAHLTVPRRRCCTSNMDWMTRAGPTAFRMKPSAKAKVGGMPKMGMAMPPSKKASQMPGTSSSRTAAPPTRRKICAAALVT